MRNSLPALAEQRDPARSGDPENQLGAPGGGGGVAQATDPGDPRAPIPDGGRRRPAGAKTSPRRWEAAVALGRASSSPPPRSRAAGCVSIEPARPSPAPPPPARAGAEGPGSLDGSPLRAVRRAVRPSVRPSPPSLLALEPSSPPPPVFRRRPSSPSSFFFPGGGGSTREAQRLRAGGAASSPRARGAAAGPRLRPAPPPHSLERTARAGRREGAEKGGRGLGRWGITASQAAAATAPPPRRRGKSSARRRRLSGAGRPPRASPQPPTAGLEAGATRSPRAGAVQADVCGGRAVGRWGRQGRRAGGRGRGWWRRGSLVRPAAAQASGPAAATRLPKVGDSDEVGQLASAQQETESPGLLHPGRLSFFIHDSDRFKSAPDFRLRVSLSTAALLPLMARSVCRKPQRQLRRSFPRRPLLELARSATQLLRVSASHRWRQAGLGRGKWPANCLKIMPLLEEILDTPIRDMSFQPCFGRAVVEFRWP